MKASTRNNQRVQERGKKVKKDQLVEQVREHVTSVPAALAALDKMEVQLDSPGAVRTYEALRKMEREAEAFAILLGDVREVRERAQLVLALIKRRLAEEIQKVPKATVSGKGQKRTGSRELAKSGRGATGIKKDSRSRIAKLLGISKKELKGIIKRLHADGKDATENAILAVLKNQDIAQRRAEHDKKAEKGGSVDDLKALIDSGKRFPVIYADPPWAFKVWGNAGKGHAGGLAENHYGTLSVAEIAALPIGQLAAKDAVLFLWCVWPELPGALDVLKAWGFEYKTAGFVWVKQNKSSDGLFYGMGYWTRANSEVCILATKGKPARVDADVQQVIVSPIGRHSEKPQEARKRIEKLLLGPYFEAFGRAAAPGWWIWGAEQPPLMKQKEGQEAAE
jgi:N6-adenosine-specific RNA methylase IME4